MGLMCYNGGMERLTKPFFSRFCIGNSWRMERVLHSKTKLLLLLTLIALMLVCTTNHDFIVTDIVVQRNGSQTLENSSQIPDRTMQLADTTQTFSFSLDSYDHMIIESSYSSSHLNEFFTYKISFTVTGGSLEFFICIAPVAETWELGYPIYVDTDKYWSSTSGVTVTNKFSSNVALAFVFNHEHSDSRSVSGSITVDTSGPSIACNLINNATYNGTVSINAAATDSISDIDTLSLYIDDVEKVESSSASFNYQWDTNRHSNGNHTIAIIAVDEADQVSLAVFDIWIYNSGPNLGSLGLVAIGFAAVVGVPALIYIWYKSKKDSSAMDMPMPEFP